jgi:osmotically-inducible protein OsmY
MVMAYYEKFDPPFVLSNKRNTEGYTQPSDQELMDLIEQRLSIFNEGDITKLRVDVRDSMVTLSGPVTSNHLKDLISKFVEKVPGVKSVSSEIAVNRVRVVSNAQ